MRTGMTRPRSALRSALSILAIYALVLQSLLAGVVAAQSVRVADADATICLTHADGRAGAPQNAPDDHSDCAAKCLLCASSHLAGALHGAAPADVAFAPSTVAWHGADWRAPALFKSISARPRGPPPAA